jgi:hypothetical protein
MTLRRANPDDPDPEGRRSAPAERRPRDPLYDELYERYARPLEAEHRGGEFIIIAPDGRYVLGDSLLDVMDKASRELGLGHYGYRIGTRYVGAIL